MVPGAALLFVLSLLAGERIEVPHLLLTWLALVYLVVCSTKLLAGFLFLVKRWSASAALYATVLFPVVTIAIGALFAAELVTWPFVAEPRWSCAVSTLVRMRARLRRLVTTRAG